MRIKTAAEAKKFIGQQLWWDDISPRWVFLRTGVLDDVHNRQLSFDESQDYRSISNFHNLRDTEKA